MEKYQYLNKALKEAEKVFKTIEPQRQAINKIIPEIKKKLSENGTDISIISKMEIAAKAGDIKTIIELKNKMNNAD